MEQRADNEEFLIRYLLGELSDDEQEQVERRYIDDREFYEHVLIVEDDLIDSYARGEMSEAIRGKFESHFLRSPERQKRVEFARALEAVVAKKSQAEADRPLPSHKPPAFGFFNFASWPVMARVAAATLILALGAWLVFETVSLRNRAERAESEKASLERRQQELEQQAEQDRRRNDDLSAQIEIERNKSAQQEPEQITPEQKTSTVVSFVLTPGMVRGAGGSNALVIGPGIRQVELEAVFRQVDYSSYRLAIQTLDGREIWSRSGLKAKSRGRSQAVTLTLPASLLNSDDYILTLSGTSNEGASEPLIEYSLSVKRK